MQGTLSRLARPSAARWPNPLRPLSRPSTWIVGVLLLGSPMRFFQLGVTNLWLDEATIWDIGRGSLIDVWNHNAAVNSAPPVYPLLIKLVEAVWGNSEAQLRSVSALAGVLALPTLFVLARRWLDAPTTGLAVALMAFAPWQIFYSRELREYSLAGVDKVTLGDPALFLFQRAPG